MSSNHVVELRVYRIHHGRRNEFADYMRGKLVPLLKRHRIDVVYYGPSLHDEDSFVIMRAYPSVADRQASLDTVFGSAEWLISHEDHVLGMIDTYDTAVLAADERLIDMLRGTFETARSPELLPAKQSK